MLLRRAAAFVIMVSGAGACGGSSSETPFPQSADEVMPAIEAIKNRPALSALPSIDLPPEPPSGPPSGRTPPPSKSPISVSATAAPPPGPPGAPPNY